MMGDSARGSSFTRAILGIPAREVHVCGDPAALPLIHALADEAGMNFSDISISLLISLLEFEIALLETCVLHCPLSLL